MTAKSFFSQRPDVGTIAFGFARLPGQFSEGRFKFREALAHF
jgi:hypothetical protein